MFWGQKSERLLRRCCEGGIIEAFVRVPNRLDRRGGKARRECFFPLCIQAASEMDGERSVAYNRRIMRSEMQKAFVLVLLLSLILRMPTVDARSGKGRDIIGSILDLNYHEFVSYPILSLLLFPFTHTAITRTPMAMNAPYTIGLPIPIPSPKQSKQPKKVQKCTAHPSEALYVIHPRRITNVVTKKKEKQQEEISSSFAGADYRWRFMIKSGRALLADLY